MVTVFTVLGVIFVMVLSFFYMFHVTEVKVAGNTRYSDDMIQQYVQDDLLMSNTMLASWFRKSIKIEDIPFVESLEIEALDRNTIRIYVNEKQIVGYVVENEHKLFFDKDYLVTEIIKKAENISKQVVGYNDSYYNDKEKKIDKILTSKLTGIPIMLILTMFIFWLTITGANYPSQLLFDLFSNIEICITDFFRNG